MKVIICEDNRHERKYLRDLITDAGSYDVIELEHANELVGVLNSNTVDIVFLDINMPGINGIEAAKAIREINSECYIVFITAYEHYALDAFSVYAFDYIVKPVNKIRLLQTLERINQKHTDKILDKLVDIKIRKTVFRIRQGDIIMVEKQFHKCFVHTKNFIYETNSSIAKIEQKLDKSLFIRVHSGYIVNKQKIMKIVPNNNLSYTIHLFGTDKLAYVSRSKRNLLDFTTFQI